jgi:toxin ParE1/3/4
MRTINYSPEAIEDLTDIVAYLDQYSPPAADRLAEAVDQRGELLAGQPGIGRERSDLKAGLRSTVVEKVYLIFDRYDSNVLEIARVLHGAHDLIAEFNNN